MNTHTIGTLYSLTIQTQDGDNSYTAIETGITSAFSITAKNLTVTGVTTDNKTYDGDDIAALHFDDAELVGVLDGDSVTPDPSAATGTFDSKNIGTFKPVTVSGLALAGPEAGNYTVTQPALSADITAKHVTGGFTANNKVYNGDNIAIYTETSLTGGIEEDDVFVTGTGATFSDENVADGKTVTLEGPGLGGTDSDNYILDSVATTTANITARPITVTAVTDTKVYDGDNTSDETPTITDGTLAAGDDAAWTQTFDDENAGTGKTLTPDGEVNDGNDGDNYDVTFINDTTGVIDQREITVTAVPDEKEYDGTTDSGGVPNITDGYPGRRR